MQTNFNRSGSLLDDQNSYAVNAAWQPVPIVGDGSVNLAICNPVRHAITHSHIKN